jgi:hypothetical protein
MKVTSPPLIAGPASAAVSLDRISRWGRGHPAAVGGIRLMFTDLCVHWAAQQESALQLQSRQRKGALLLALLHYHYSRGG